MKTASGTKYANPMLKKIGVVSFLTVQNNPVLFFVLLSLNLSLWSALADDVTNLDGTIYLTAANHFAMGNWAEGFATYKWPAYPILAGGIMWLTGTIPYAAAQILNAGLSALNVIVFIAIVRLMGATPRGLIAAGALIVGHLWLNDMRPMIVRDHGYITFYLMTIYFLFRDIQTPRLLWKAAWIVTLASASLFRVEGFVFFAAIPLFYGFAYSRTRIGKGAFIGLGLLIALSLPLAISLWQSGFVKSLYTAFTNDNLGWLLNAIDAKGFSRITARVETLREGILNPAAREYAWYAYFGVTLSILFGGIMQSITLLYGPMGIIGLWVKRFIPRQEFVAPLIWLAVSHVLMLAIFVFHSLYSDWRFGTALSVTLTIPAAFTLIAAYRYWWFASPDRIRRNFFVPATLITLVIAFALEGLPSYSRYRYIKDAAQWIRENTAEDQVIISNNPVLMYYAGRWDRQSTFRSGYYPHINMMVSDPKKPGGTRAGVHIAVIDVRSGTIALDEKVADYTNSEVIATFANDRGDHLTILRFSAD